MPKVTNLEKVVNYHAALVEDCSPYSYIEITYHRSSGYGVYVCTKCVDNDPERIVLLRGYSHTSVEDACRDALLTPMWKGIEKAAAEKKDGATQWAKVPVPQPSPVYATKR